MNLTSRKKTPVKKKAKKSTVLYWVTVIALSIWMIYLNINVIMEYRGVSEKYCEVLEEYQLRKKELEEKILEYQRLQLRLEEHGLQ